MNSREIEIRGCVRATGESSVVLAKRSRSLI